MVQLGGNSLTAGSLPQEGRRGVELVQNLLACCGLSGVLFSVIPDLAVYSNAHFATNHKAYKQGNMALSEEQDKFLETVS